MIIMLGDWLVMLTKEVDVLGFGIVGVGPILDHERIHFRVAVAGSGCKLQK